jgi:hypothetical protein
MFGRKKFKSLEDAIKDYVRKTPSVQQMLSEHGLSESNIAVTSLPSEYNSVSLGGDMYINGKACRTVGEYKIASKKF